MIWYYGRHSRLWCLLALRVLSLSLSLSTHTHTHTHDTVQWKRNKNAWVSTTTTTVALVSAFVCFSASLLCLFVPHWCGTESPVGPYYHHRNESNRIESYWVKSTNESINDWLETRETCVGVAAIINKPNMIHTYTHKKSSKHTSIPEIEHRKKNGREEKQNITKKRFCFSLS